MDQMQVKELVWQQDSKNCEWKEHDNGSVQLTIENASVCFKDRTAAAQMIEAWSVFNRTEEAGDRTAQPTPKPQRLEPAIGADFPKKVRNAIFIMVGLGATIVIVDALRYLNSGQ
jgi:hypothetical protein